MNPIITKVLFAFRFAFQNIIHDKVRTLLLTLSMTIMAIIILLGFSAPNFMETYYHENMIEPYGNKDIVMKVNENTLTRYFSVRQLKEHPEINTIIDKWTPLFEINTLIGYSTFEKQYTKVLASELIHFHELNSHLNYEGTELSFSEAIITKSLSIEYNLSIGDTITMYVGSSAKQYNIIDIVMDDGLFAGDTIFINKADSLSFFLTALNPNIIIPNPQFLFNLYNTVYFETDSTITTMEGIEFISSIQEYNNLEIKPTVDYGLVGQYIDRSLSIYRVIIVMIFIAIIIVIQSTYLVFFESRKKQYAVVGILSGNTRYSYHVTMIEMLLMFVIVTFISNIGASMIMNLGLKYIGVNQNIIISLSHRVYSSMIMIFVFFILSSFYFFKIKKNSMMTSSMEQSNDMLLFRKSIIVVFSGLIVIYIICLVLKFQFPQFYVISLIITIISVIFMLVLSLTLFIILIHLLKKSKILLFTQLQLSILGSKKAFFQYTIISLVSLLSIFLLVLTSTHMQSRMNQAKEDYILDYALTNIVSRFDETLNDVKNMDAVSSADPVLMAQNIMIEDFNQVVTQLISVESHKINHYYGYEISEALIQQLDTNIPSIILPTRYQTLYGMEPGETIYITISRSDIDIEMLLVGFYDNHIGNVAFSNIIFTSEIQPNAILVTESDSYFGLKEALIDLYSKNLVYVIDYNQVVNEYIKQVSINTNYMIYTISIMILCFVFSIVNYNMVLFEDMKNIYAKIIVIGSSKWRLIKEIILETGIMIVVFLCASIITFSLISNELSNIILLFGEVEVVVSTPLTLVIGTFIAIIVIIISRIIYIMKVIKMDTSQIIRMETF